VKGSEVNRFSNPVRSVDLDWPAANGRTVAKFRVLALPGGLERVSRRTSGKSRYSPAGERVRIVTGSDGKTYVAGIRRSGAAFLMDGTMRKIEWFVVNHPMIETIKKAIEL